MKSDLNAADGSALMKIVQSIAISPEDAREVVHSYQSQLSIAEPELEKAQVLDAVISKIISRYANLAAASGGRDFTSWRGSGCRHCRKCARRLVCGHVNVREVSS